MNPHFARFLKAVAYAPRRFEYLGGWDYPFAKKSPAQAQRNLDLLLALYPLLTRNPQWVLAPGSVLVVCPWVEAALYPDVAVVAAPVRYSPLTPPAIAAPVFIAEVNDPSPRQRARCAAYTSLDSVVEYLRLDPSSPGGELKRRLTGGIWQTAEVDFRLGPVRLESLSLNLWLPDFPPADPDAESTAT